MQSSTSASNLPAAHPPPPTPGRCVQPIGSQRQLASFIHSPPDAGEMPPFEDDAANRETVSIHSPDAGEMPSAPAHLPTDETFQSTPPDAGGRCPLISVVSLPCCRFQSTPPDAGGRCPSAAGVVLSVLMS